jgi:hypothetical protein
MVPALAEAARRFGKPSIDQSGIKPKKQPLKGSMGEIATLSMNNQTGLITWLIAKAWANGREDFVEQLVPELQAAVDMLKGASPPDQGKLDFIADRLSQKDVVWLKDYKSKDAYLNRPLAVSNGATDTISRLVREANLLWIPPQMRKSSLRSFLPLFPEVSDRWVAKANLRYHEYSAAIKAATRPALRYKLADKPVPRAVEEKVSAALKQVATRFGSLLENTPEDSKLTAAAALWQSGHSADDNSVTLVFASCLDQICQQLSEQRLNKFAISGLAHGHYAEAKFANDLAGIKVIAGEKQPAVVDRNGNLIGFIPASSWCPTIGDELVVQLRTLMRQDGKPGSVQAVIADEF